MRFDPQTGKPIDDNQTPKFDPTTGQPIMQNAQNMNMQNQGPRFDPVTGQPIMQNAQNMNMQQGPKFDPRTGQPIMQGAPQNQAYGYAMNNQAPKKSNAGKIAGVGVAAVAVATAGVFGFNALASSGAPDKILTNAIETTINKATTTPETEFIAKNSDNITANVTLEGNFQGMPVSVDVTYAKGKKESSLAVKANAAAYKFDVASYLNDKELIVSMPDVLDQNIFYNYVDEKNGDLATLLSTSGEVKYEQIDAVLKTLSNYDSIIEDFKEGTKKAAKELDFKKAEAKEFTISGKEEKCKGYTAVVSKDTIKNMFNDYKEALSDNEELMSLAENIYGTSWDQALDKLADEFSAELDDSDSEDSEGESNSTVDVSYYVNGKDLAAIIFANGEGEDAEQVQILFQGGEYASQNLVVKTIKDGQEEEVYKVEGQTVDGVRTSKTYQEGQLTSSYEWNTKTGEFSLETGEAGSYDYNKIAGTLKSGDDSLEAEFNDMTFSGTKYDGITLKFSIKKGADINKLSSKGGIDLGNASSEELQEVVQKIQSYYGG